LQTFSLDHLKGIAGSFNAEGVQSVSRAITKVENKLIILSDQQLTSCAQWPAISFRGRTCYRAIENQNVPMMFLVAAR
jgi:hypothetical protein